MLSSETTIKASSLRRCVSPERKRRAPSCLSPQDNSSGLVNLISMSLVMGDQDNTHELFQNPQPRTSPLDLLEDLFNNEDYADAFGESTKILPVVDPTVSFDSIMNDEDLEPLPLAPQFSQMPNSNNSPALATCHLVTPSLTATAAAEGALERLLAQEFHLGKNVSEPIAASSDGKRAAEEEESSPVPKKKRCTSPRNICEEGPKFRDYQEQQWSDKFEELLKYKVEYGHCLVPHTYEGNPALSRWVKRQRYQYKLFHKNSGESTMTKNRVNMLENIGFVWDSHAIAWGERLEELKEFQAKFGHCNVPSYYQKSPPLAVWVKRQRRQVKLFWKGERSTITQERFEALRDLGFTWELRRSKNSL